MIRKKTVFTVDGKKLAVVKPTNRHSEKADIIYGQKFREFATSGSILRGAIEGLLKEQNVWTDKDNEEFEKLNKILADGEKKLKAGGFSFSEAVELAKKMRATRYKLIVLQNKFNQYDSDTAEAKAENHRFHYLVSECTVYHDSGEPYFKTYEDYEKALDNEDKVVGEATQHLIFLLNNISEDYEKQLPENKFLLEYNLVNDKLQLLNEDKKPVDDDGRLIDEEGNWINEAGEKVDKFYNVIDEKVKFSPFLDDKGKPVKKV